MDGNKGSGPSLGAVFGTLKEGVFGRVTAFPDCVCVCDIISLQIILVRLVQQACI